MIPTFQQGQAARGLRSIDPRIILHYQGNGASIVDSSIHNRVITVSGATLSTTQTKYSAKSLAFNGSDQYVSCAFLSDMEFGSSDFTIEGWVYLASNTGTWHTFISKNAGPGAPSGMMRLLLQPGRVFASISSTDYDWNTATGMTLSAWHHVAWTKQGQNMYGFVDGTLVGSTSSAVSTIPTYSVAFRIGTQQDGNSLDLNGYVDNFRIIKGLALYTANFTPPTQALQPI
jgi:hypothetical protein